jgi:DNA-binding response OmpR family regulator
MTLAPLILVVDDDAELGDMLMELLSRQGWRCHHVLTGGEAEQMLALLRPQMVVLDVMLPDVSGMDLCRRWRAVHPSLGILMLTARGDPFDRVTGLEIGADDYLSKPFEARELVARVRALLRRALPRNTPGSVMRYDGLEIDLERNEVLADTRLLSLTGTEFRLLAVLAAHPGELLSAEDLSQGVPSQTSVAQQLERLRGKLREASPGEEWVNPVQGEGYVFLPRGWH